MEDISEGYIARDKNGDLYLYSDKPERSDYRHNVWISKYGVNYYAVNNNSFPEVQWETEPKKVQVIIKDINEL